MLILFLKNNILFVMFRPIAQLILPKKKIFNSFRFIYTEVVVIGKTHKG